MYPFFRFLKVIVSGFLKKELPIATTGKISFRVRPWDLDLFMEANNGRIVTFYDLGRFDLAHRTGLLKILKKNSWGLVVAGSTVRYRRRLKIFNKCTMHTKIAAIDERWIYLEQAIYVNNTPATSFLVRTAVTEKGKILPSEQVLQEMNLSAWQPQPSPWVQSWIESEEKRPWPPEL